MRMPGFTAEASLYKTNERYHMLGTLDRLTGCGDVNNQRLKSVQPAASIYVDGLYYCEGYIDRFGNVRCASRFSRGALNFLAVR